MGVKYKKTIGGDDMLSLIKEIIVASLKLETHNELLHHKKNLLVKIGKDVVKISVHRFSNKEVKSVKFNLEHFSSLVDYIKGVLDCNFNNNLILLEHDKTAKEIKIFVC